MAPSEPVDPRRVWDNLQTRAAPRADRPSGARRMMRELYGSSGRGQRIDTRAVAADLGVSQRTVQRWLKNGMPPKSAAAQAATQKHAEWQNSPEGRKRYLGRQEEQKIRTAQTAAVSGKIVVSGDDDRTRTVTLNLEPGDLDALIESLMSGDDQGAHDALEDLLSEQFGGAVSLTLNNLNLS